MLNLDTHILLYALAGSLRPTEQRLLTANQWSISGIVLWEIAKLAQLGRIALDLEDVEVVRALARVHVWPITREIAHTSLVHNVPLITRDRRLLRSRQVPLAPGRR
jgi:PIN domain nuclease of toxin-antitoxin system